MVVSPVARDALTGLFQSTVPATHIIVVLAFGERRVSVPGSPFMPVSTLRSPHGWSDCRSRPGIVFLDARVEDP
jgi:hypothetical protein